MNRNFVMTDEALRCTALVHRSIAFNNEKQSIQNGTNLYVPTSPTFQNDNSLSIWPNQTQWLPKFGDNGVQGMTRSGRRRGQVTYHGYGGPTGTVHRRQTGISAWVDLPSAVYLVERGDDGMEAGRRRRRFALVQPWNLKQIIRGLNTWLVFQHTAYRSRSCNKTLTEKDWPWIVSSEAG